MSNEEPNQPTPQAPVAPPAGNRPQGQPLSGFLKISIALLAALTIASISLLFIGDFEGKFVRVFSTFALFAVFVLLTALDTRSNRKSEWYAPVALIANAYILAILLCVIWVTPYRPFSLGAEIFWKSVLVLIVVRTVILCCELLLRTGSALPALVSRFAFVTSVLAVLSGILFTAPIGIEPFDVVIPDLYWKIATATLILTALGLAITLLLRWSYGAENREAARAARQSTFQPLPVSPQPGHPQPGYPQSGHFQPGHPWAEPATGAPQPGQSAHPQPDQSTSSYSASSHPGSSHPAPPQPPASEGASAPQELLPWPRFPDGRPLPAGPDGQPDFSALNPPH